MRARCTSVAPVQTNDPWSLCYSLRADGRAGLKVVTREDADAFDELILNRLTALLAQCARAAKRVVWWSTSLPHHVAKTEADGAVVIDEARTGVLPRSDAATFFDQSGYPAFGAFLRDRSRPGFLAVVRSSTETRRGDRAPNVVGSARRRVAVL